MHRIAIPVTPGLQLFELAIPCEVFEAGRQDFTGLDLCLHIVSNDHGTKIANTLARRLVIPPHRDGGQAQYIEQPLPPTAPAASARRLTGPRPTSSCR